MLAIGSFSDIDPRADIYHPERIRIGHRVRISARAILNLRSGRSQLPSDRPWNLRIGDGTKIMPDAKLIPQQGFIDIGAHCTVQYGCLLYGVGGLTIGEHTRIAAGTIITPMNHTFSDVKQPIWQQPETAVGISIGRDCWIGAGVRILDGVSIGDGCVIGAGSVVTHDLSDYSVAVGTPARVVRSRVTSTFERYRKA
jgi:acetyltransferase-like isoleucine patch superfamily enzyme